MTAIVERLARRFSRLRAGARRQPEVSMYRIYRDTRFSENKTPLQDARRRGLSDAAAWRSTKAPALYFHVAPDEVWIGGGMYAPQPPQLQAVREHIAANVRRLRAIVESPAFRRDVGPLEGEQLQRVPRGFPKDHAAAEYLKLPAVPRRRASFPPSFASSPRFYAACSTSSGRSRRWSRFLNEPLLDGRAASRCAGRDTHGTCRHRPRLRAGNGRDERTATTSTRLSPSSTPGRRAPRRDGHTARLRAWLEQVVAQSASDLLLVAGAPPSLRVVGRGRAARGRPARRRGDRRRGRARAAAARAAGVSATPASPTPRSGRRTSAASASTCIASAGAPRRRSAACRRRFRAWPASACRRASKR